MKKIRKFSTADNMTFICFKYALNSLLGTKENLQRLDHFCIKRQSCAGEKRLVKTLGIWVSTGLPSVRYIRINIAIVLK